MTTDSNQSALRAHVLDLLRGDNAHADFDKALAGLSPADRGNKAAGSPFTAWQLLEHLRISQLDILEFSRNGKHKSPKWPDDYWPKSEVPPNEDAWDVSAAHFRRDHETFTKLIADPERDLLAPIAHAPDGQTLLREALVLADHNSYHIGQIILIRKFLDAWK